MNVFLLPEISKTTLNGIKSTDVVPKPLNSSGYNYYTTQTNDAIFKLINEPENELLKCNKVLKAQNNFFPLRLHLSIDDEHHARLNKLIEKPL